MNRLRRGCLVGSLVGHGLLAALLVLGAGFFQSKPPVESTPILTFIPDRLIDAQGVGGGNPRAQPPPPVAAPIILPAATPPPPSPVRPVETARAPTLELPRPEPRTEPPPQPKPVPDLEPVERREPKPNPPKLTEPEATTEAESRRPKSSKRVIVPNLQPVQRGRDTEREARARAEAQAQAQARALRAAENARRAHVIGSLSALESKLSSSASVDVLGPGGESFANYGAYVQTLYDRAWHAPDDLGNAKAQVKVRVVIARDGRVLDAHRISSSAYSALDNSVQAALDRVRDIGKPFPEGAKEDQRTFIINFNLEAKRALE